jgi:hypothetical protein
VFLEGSVPQRVEEMLDSRPAHPTKVLPDEHRGLGPIKPEKGVPTEQRFVP